MTNKSVAEDPARRKRLVDPFLAKLTSETPPAYDEKKLKDVCTSILSSPERLQMVRALLSSIVDQEHNDNQRIKSEQFVELADCKGGWLPYAEMPTGQTIRNFLKGSKPQGSQTLAAYLYGLAVLMRLEHPAFRQPVPQVLASFCEPLTTFEDQLDSWAEKDSKLRVRSVARTGFSLYHILRRGHAPVVPSVFEPLLRSKLFQGLDPAADDLQLDENQIHLTAIRLGASGSRYVVSKVSVALIKTETQDREHQTFLYLRTWMRSSPRGRAVMRSHGFIVPRDKFYYLAQYHLEGHGFNFTAVVASDILDAHQLNSRALILAVDRDGDAGVLGSKLMLFRANMPDLLIGNFTRAELENAVNDDDCGVSVPDMIEYLHNAGPIAIRVPHGDTTGRAPLSTWRDLLDYVTTPGVADMIRTQRAEEQFLLGDVMSPLRAT